MSHYEVLGVANDADAGEVRRAYVALARQHHPDRVGGDADRMRAINEAWAVLGDPLRRLQYDQIRTRTTASTERTRRSGVPDPNYDPYDDIDDERPYDDLDDDLDDDYRGRVTVALPGWLAVIPVGLFAASIILFFLGAVFSSSPIIALSLMTVVISALMFVAAPFMALLVSRSPGRSDRDEG